MKSFKSKGAFFGSLLFSLCLKAEVSGDYALELVPDIEFAVEAKSLLQNVSFKGETRDKLQERLGRMGTSIFFQDYLVFELRVCDAKAEKFDEHLCPVLYEPVVTGEVSLTFRKSFRGLSYFKKAQEILNNGVFKPTKLVLVARWQGMLNFDRPRYYLGHSFINLQDLAFGKNTVTISTDSHLKLMTVDINASVVNPWEITKKDFTYAAIPPATHSTSLVLAVLSHTMGQPPKDFLPKISDYLPIASCILGKKIDLQRVALSPTDAASTLDLLAWLSQHPHSNATVYDLRVQELARLCSGEINEKAEAKLIEKYLSQTIELAGILATDPLRMDLIAKKQTEEEERLRQLNQRPREDSTQAYYRYMLNRERTKDVSDFIGSLPDMKKFAGSLLGDRP